MAKKRELSIEERAKIVAFKKAGLRYRAIAAEIGCSISTVNYTFKKHEAAEGLHTKLGRGRKKILTKSEKKWIFLNSMRHRFKSHWSLNGRIQFWKETSH